MYSDVLLDHFRNPRNAGPLLNADGVGEAEDPTCGDLAKISLRVSAGRVAQARFQTYGCGPSIAAASLATELVRGMTLDEAGALSADRIEVALGGLPSDRRHAAQVVAEAIRAAVQDYRAKARRASGRTESHV